MREAVGARSISTSSTSKLSSLLSADGWGVELAIGVRLIDSTRKCLASGDSGVGLGRTEPRSGLLPLASPDRPKPSAFLKPDEAFGVSGVVGGVVRSDDEEDGRAMTCCLTEVVGDECLLGETLVLGDIILLFLLGVDGAILIADVRLTFKAVALFGRGLMGLKILSVGDDCSNTEVPLLANPLSSFSSSVLVLSFLRVPARGGVKCFKGGSMAVDLGRYLGRAVVCEDLGRNDDDRVIRVAFRRELGSAEHTPCSSTGTVTGVIEVEMRLFERVTLFESPILSRLDIVDFASPMDKRPTPGKPAVVGRRGLVADPASLVFFAFSACPLCSDLFITSASAFPMEDMFNDCRIELRVVGLGGRKPPALVSMDMVRTRIVIGS